jgi:uncharacterized protein
MKLDLSEVVSNPGMHVTQEIDEPCSKDLEIDCVAPVKGTLKFSNTGTLLLIQGEVHTEVRLECARCLVEYTTPVKVEIEEEYKLEKVGDAMQALPIEEEVGTPDLIKSNVLDVTELARQNLIVELPIQPLCKPECSGLCPTCGENLNMRKCSCPPAEPESPFIALADLLGKDEE